MTNESGIYLIKNKINNRVYVGQSSNIKERWKSHKKRLRKGNHDNPHLQSSWLKYGEISFEFIFLEKCDKQYLSSFEESYRNYYRNLPSGIYNIGECLSNPFLGRKHSEETKKKMRQNHADIRGNKNPMFGKAGFGGKKHTEETKKKLRENALRRNHENSNRTW